MNTRQQTDLLFLDFSKAFDTVPHKKAISQTKFLWCTKVSFSLDFLLANQTVVVDGESSDVAPVRSRVPQGTVLGPLMFLTYINDINENISSSIRWFADDCIIYKTITTTQDAEQLQDDLRKICEWTNKWQMKLNVDKCVVLRCARSQCTCTL